MAKVLLVEDDNNLREIYEARLSAEAYTIITAQNGEEALVVAKKEHPDLIISDVMMPRISGFEMLDILRNTDELRDTKVIMLTALGQAEDQSRAGKLGADKYLVKSQVTLEDIVNTANELLGIIPAVSPTTAPDPSPTSIPAPVATPVVTSGLDPVSTPPIAQPASNPPTNQQAPQQVTAPVTQPAIPDPISAAPVPVAAPTVVEPVSAEPAPETPTPAVVQDSVPQANQVPVIADPVAIPEPTPIPEPVATAIPVPNQADFEEAQTMAAEEATVESQIETFATNAPTQEASTAPALTQVADQAETANDQTLTEAVNDLTAATSVGPEPVLPPSQQQVPGEETPADQSAPTTFVAPPLEPTTPTPEPAPTDPSSPETQAVAGHKIIQPINTTTGPNLDELLAKEEAKELQQNGQQAAPIVNGTPAATNPGFDPNSIAL